MKETNMVALVKVQLLSGARWNIYILGLPGYEWTEYKSTLKETLTEL